MSQVSTHAYWEQRVFALHKLHPHQVRRMTGDKNHRSNPKVPKNMTHSIHVWYSYLHLVDLFMINVGQYIIHGCFGLRSCF